MNAREVWTDVNQMQPVQIQRAHTTVPVMLDILEMDLTVQVYICEQTFSKCMII